MSTDTFTPRWASAPAETLVRWLDSRSLPKAQLPSLLERSDAWCTSFLAGSERVDAEAAASLASLTGTPAAFWLNREACYRQDQRRVEADEWAQGLPMPDMEKLGWVPRARDWKHRAELALSFFGVDTVEEWRSSHESFMLRTRFRTSRHLSLSDVSISAWIRQCERSALPADSPFDERIFEEVLLDARRLVKWGDPSRFLPALQGMLARSGVRIAVVPALPGTGISGATWRDSNSSPVIGLTARNLVEDHFWFSFFHEAAHIQLHHSAGPFVDSLEDQTEEAARPADPIETAADARAIELMLEQPHSLLALNGRESLKDLTRAAAANCTSVGVVVGQLQHLGILSYAQRNGWKRRYRWRGSSLGMK